VLFTGAAQVYRTGIGFISGMILARLLAPADFGLVAMVGTCVALVAPIQDLGLNQATIQRSQISRKQLSALFWLSVGTSFFLGLGLALLGPGVAWFFGDSRLTLLTVAFAVLVALSGVQSLPSALMNRELRFKALAAIDIVTATASACAGVAVAYRTGSYWALFVSAFVTTVVNLLGVWLLSGFRPGSPSFEGSFRDIVGFGSSISGFNVVNYFARNADNLLIGKFYGGEQLGYYDRAYRLLVLPLQQTTWPLGRVMVPFLSRSQADPEHYRKVYTECISSVMMAAQPAIVFAVVFSHDVIRILFGSQWLPAASIFQWLGLCSLHQVVTSTSGWLYLSQGRGGDYFKIGLFNAVATVASFVIGLPWSALGVAVAYTVANYVIMLPATWWNVGRHGPVKTCHLVSTAMPHFIASALTIATMLGLRMTIGALNLGWCFALALLSYVVYGLVLLSFPTKRQLIGGKMNIAIR